MTVIIDYGAGNIKSVEKALLSLGQEVVITDDADTILNAERIILPGVGAFGNAMAQLEKTGLDEVIREAVRRKIPFLGICLGLQLLFEKSDETDRQIHFLFPRKHGYVPHIRQKLSRSTLLLLPGNKSAQNKHIHASVEKENVFACQFHPEKSGETGLKILKNFTEL